MNSQHFLFVLLALVLSSKTLLAAAPYQEKNKTATIVVSIDQEMTVDKVTAHRVTVDEYCDFLKVSHATGLWDQLNELNDVHRLYDEKMGWDEKRSHLGSIIRQEYSPESRPYAFGWYYNYKVVSGKEREPITYVSSFAAACY